MDSLLNHPLLQPQYINQVISSIPIDTERYMLSEEIPLVNHPGNKIVVDIDHQMGGMTQAVARGAESPTVDQHGMAQVVFRPAQWREKYPFTENDIAVIRRLGTLNELETAETKIAKILKGLRYRLENRMEQLKWDMVRGTVTIAQADIQYTVDYAVPSEFTPTLAGADLWSDPSSTPLDDMLDWLDLYRYEPSEPNRFVYNTQVEKALLQNDQIRTLRDAMFTGQPNASMLTRENVKLVIAAYTGAIPHVVYDKGYWLVMKAMNAVTPASTSLTVDDATGLETGDEFIVEHRDSIWAGRVKITATGVTGNVISHAAIGGSVTYPVASVVKISKPFVKDNEFIIMGKVIPGSIGVEKWGEFASTDHYYGEEGLMKPEQGVYARVDNHNKSDPPRIEVISGVNGLPTNLVPTNNVVASVL